MNPARFFPALVAGALLLVGCNTNPSTTPSPSPTASIVISVTAQPRATETPPPPVAEATPPATIPTDSDPMFEGVAYVNPVLGVRMLVPQGLRVVEPEYLMPDSYGFTVVEAQGGLVMKVDWLRTAPDTDAGQAAQRLIDSYPGTELRLERTPVLGQAALMVFPVPGQQPNTYLFTTANDRLYQIIYGAEQLDERGVAMLETLTFEAPTQTLDSLDLPTDDSQPQPEEQTSPTATLPPTEAFQDETPTAMPDGTEAPTPASAVPAGWTMQALPDVGVTLAIPPEWVVTRQPGLYGLGTGAGVEEQWLYLTFRSDAPQDLDALTDYVAQLLADQDITDFTTPILIGGQQGIALEGLPTTCRDIYVPAAGLVHQLTVTSLGCEGASEFSPVTQLILNTITFTPATAP